MLLKIIGLKDDFYFNEEEFRFRGGIFVCIYVLSSYIDY